MQHALWKLNLQAMGQLLKIDLLQQIVWSAQRTAAKRAACIVQPTVCRMARRVSDPTYATQGAVRSVLEMVGSGSLGGAVAKHIIIRTTMSPDLETCEAASINR